MSQLYTYGIDFYAAHLLHAIRDEARFRAISHGHRDQPTGHYTWLPQVLHATEAGRMTNDLGLEKLGLKAYADHWHHYQEGEMVPAAKDRPSAALGFMLFVSLANREEVLEKTRIARDCLRFDLE